MRRSDFYYKLPEELIAYYPTSERTQSRLLYLNGDTGNIAHHQFIDFPQFLEPGDLLILNNTRVIPARLYGQKISGGKVEILVERVIDEHQVLVHCKASKRPKIGTQLILENILEAEVIDTEGDLLKLNFYDNRSVMSLLEQYGHMPLPLYITRPDEKIDKDRYQTVYSQYQGSVAAPTAGLHFDQAMLKKLTDLGIQIAYITLHVGAGTFQPVRVENLEDHKMHTEYAELSAEIAQQIQVTKNNGKKIIAVGTTATRTLETAAINGKIEPYIGETNLFIKPGFEFHCVDAMITNFHAPETTLLMLVSAFAGYENIKVAYQEAIKNRYRFYSYGDAMFITRKK